MKKFRGILVSRLDRTTEGEKPTRKTFRVKISNAIVPSHKMCLEAVSE